MALLAHLQFGGLGTRIYTSGVTFADASAVTLHDVRQVFGTVRALDGMTWSAPTGQTTAVLGPNGAGKSTAIECAIGLQQPVSGTVRVLGADPWGATAEHRARVGVMLQSGGLPNGTTAARLLPHLATLHRHPADVPALRRMLGIDEFATTTIRRLSGGQKQRLALAAALIGRPEVVFLDEPTAGLDPHGRLDVWDLVEGLRADGVTVIVTTHSFEEAEWLASHLVIVSAGRTVAEGSPGEISGARGLEHTYFEITRRPAS